jgi:hypothetical protein
MGKNQDLGSGINIPDPQHYHPVKKKIVLGRNPKLKRWPNFWTKRLGFWVGSRTGPVKPYGTVYISMF